MNETQIQRDGTEGATDDTKEQLIEGGSFADEVDAAIDNLQLPEPAPDMADARAEIEAASTATNQPEARAEYEPYPPELLATGGNENDVPAPASNDVPVQQIDLADEDAVMAAAGHVAGVGFTATEPLAPGQVIITNEPDDSYDANMAEIKGKPGFRMFAAGFDTCLSMLQDFIDQHKDDEDMVAIIFKAHTEPSPLSEYVAATAEWAAKQDVSDGALQPKLSDGEELEKRQLDLSTGQPKMPADRDGALSAFDRAELEKMTREAQAETERLQIQLNRENDAMQLWAALSEYFNLVMTDEPESTVEEPLVVRIQLYVNRLREENWQAENADHKNEPDFYDLPPMLADLLKGQPEAAMALLPGHQLVLMVQRLWRENAENAEDAAKYRNLAK